MYNIILNNTTLQLIVENITRYTSLQLGMKLTDAMATSISNCSL